MTELGLALVAGLVTIAAPCILPMLPILLGAAVAGRRRTRPLAIVAGFVATFAAAGLVLGRLASIVGTAPSTLRTAAIVLLVGFGGLMLWPELFAYLTRPFGGVVRRADAVAARAGSGNVGGLVLGATIGILWTPCAGPVLGSILTLVATAEDARGAGALLLAYAVGAVVPMLAIAYGGQRVAGRLRRLTPHAARLQRAFGVLVIASAAAMYSGWDTAVAARLAGAFVSAGGARAAVSAEQSPAPELTGLDHWINSAPLTLHALRGDVVLVDFWTFGCVNCVRTLPHVRGWYERYKDAGLIVIGVHTPEFPYERDPANVAAAVTRHRIAYPVAQDDAYATWKAYDNHDWPAQYLIDRRGRIVRTHVGEGGYEEMEDAIRAQLGIASSGAAEGVPRGEPVRGRRN